ncbi:hypothetical protein R2601_04553 [Salipiger bermudensis HTCC2601]|uniref:Uncharacterized protein n=1 Tax=Salipiger bermudensis (strain DSM 26914 / JCM 13377 / KCTC 12554 / HTCC2601) TaxID=314265 RepID=Q0FVT5_SALBH|nr:hypothetical protein R2601_04553 [Salipiger bermudensis HTCC2601]
MGAGRARTTLSRLPTSTPLRYSPRI